MCEKNSYHRSYLQIYKQLNSKAKKQINELSNHSIKKIIFSILFLSLAIVFTFVLDIFFFHNNNYEQGIFSNNNNNNVNEIAYKNSTKIDDLLNLDIKNSKQTLTYNDNFSFKKYEETAHNYKNNSSNKSISSNDIFLI